MGEIKGCGGSREGVGGGYGGVGGYKLEKENYFMLIGFEMSSIYIIKMQIDT